MCASLPPPTGISPRRWRRGASARTSTTGLDVDSVRLAPLRERRDDIPALTRFFLERLCAELGVPQPKLDAWDLDPLCSCDWPGNVRELRNVIKRWLLLGRRLGQCVGTGGTPAKGRADTEPDHQKGIPLPKARCGTDVTPPIIPPVPMQSKNRDNQSAA